MSGFNLMVNSSLTLKEFNQKCGFVIQLLSTSLANNNHVPNKGCSQQRLFTLTGPRT